MLEKAQNLKDSLDLILTVPGKMPTNSVKTSFQPTPVWEFKNVLTSLECQEIIHHFSKNPSYGVGVQGLTTDSGIGSQRVSAFDINFAKLLDQKLKALIHNLHPLHHYSINEYSKVDASSGLWSYQHVSPYFRYMRYSKDGHHAVHYDSPHKINDNLQTLLSGVIYLTINDSCPTVFIDDKQDELLFKDRNTRDWLIPFEQDQVICKSYPETGKVILFEHQQAHAVEPLLKDEDRIIIRFDVYYSKD